MTIEVRQLLIRSTVGQTGEAERETVATPRDTEELKTQILSECREMVLDLLRTRKER